MYRFFVPPAWLIHDVVQIQPPLAHQLDRVLRLRRGDHIILLDNSGSAFEVELDEVRSAQSRGHIVHVEMPQTEPRTHVTLCQAIPKGKKLDWVLQKGTELGMSAFVPMLTQHCTLRDMERIDQQKIERWERILTEAAEQSGRARIPGLEPVSEFTNLCSAVDVETLHLMACLDEQAVSLRQTLLQSSRVPRVRLYIGPEGGLAPEEVAMARASGILPVSLGRRILRTETAGLATLAMLLYAWGEME